jgi:hypothetical protein
MPTNRRPLQRRRARRSLNADQLRELWLGPRSDRSAFGSKEELRAAWSMGRDRLMVRHGQRGRRPMGWWEFEAPFPYPGYDAERAVLFEHGLLAEQERKDLVALWHEQFERAQRPDFMFNAGAAGGWLDGEAAKQANYRWAGIPKSLVQTWTRKS